MKILQVNEKQGMVKVKVESDEDLWLLYTTIVKGDIVYARTTREIKADSTTGRGSSRRIPLILGIKVLKCEFQPFTNRLRIHGIIIDAPERYGLQGSHHTISVDTGAEITIIKEKGWTPILLKRLNRQRLSRLKILIVAIDRDEVAAGILYDYGINIILDHAIRVQGKSYEGREGSIRQVIAEVVKEIEGVITRYSINVVVVSGPGFIKEELLSILKDRITNVKFYLEHVSTGGVKGVKETLRKDSLRNIAKEYGLLEEEELIERFLKLLIKDPERVVYGLDDVLKMAEIGAIETLLIMDEFLTVIDVETRRKVEKILTLVENYKGAIKIFSSHHDPGLQLKSLGGIAAILRYKVPR